MPIASARAGAGAGDADAPSGPSSVNSTAGTAGSNPVSRSSSMSHVRNRYVDVFANAAPGDADAPGESGDSSNTLLAPVLPGGVPTSGALAPNAPGAGANGAPKFFMPMVPSAQSMTSGASQDGDTDTDTGGANADEGVDARASRSVCASPPTPPEGWPCWVAARGTAPRRRS